MKKVLLAIFVMCLFFTGANRVDTNTIKIDSTGSVRTRPTRVMAISFIANADNDILFIKSGALVTATTVFYSINDDVSALGREKYYYLGGARFDSIYITTLSAGCTAYIYLK